MADVEIGQMDTTIEFESETGAPNGAPLSGQPDAPANDMERLRALLRPVILEILDDELSRYVRMRG